MVQQRFQPVQRVQRLARRERIRLDAGERFFHRRRRRLGRRDGRGEEVDLRIAGALLRLERLERGARLAGMPAGLVRQARATLEALEAQQQAGSAQIDLFAPPAAAPEPQRSAADEALAALEPDTLTPREALDALYRLKALQGKST